MVVKLDTKHANGFIREYNDLLPMKKYSKMTVGQKNELIRKKMHTLRTNTLVKDLERLEKAQKTKDSDLKTAMAQQGSQKKKADMAKKKEAQKKAASAASQKNLQKIAAAQKEARKKKRPMPPGLAKALEAKQRPVANAREITGAI